MDIKEFLALSDTLIDVRASDKTRLLQELTRRAATILDLPAERLSAFLAEQPLSGSSPRRHDAPRIAVPASLPTPRGARLSTQEAFGRLILRRSMAGESILYSCFSSRPTRRRTSSRRLHDAACLCDLRSASSSAGLYHAMTT